MNARPKVVEMPPPREVDPVVAWIERARDRARSLAKGVESAGRVGHAVAKLLDEAGKALKGDR